MGAKVDLHVHSSYSNRPSEWLLRRIGAPECYTPPQQVYDECRRKGMDFVTLSDHNCIDGALEIAHLPGVFVSNEVTTYFPEDGCKVHCLVFGITEDQFRDIQELRTDIYAFRDYLFDREIAHSVAHPLFSVNDRLNVGHLAKLLVLFKRFEGINGARAPRAAMLFRAIVQNLSPQMMAELADRHDIVPRDERPWQKVLTGGSDDHSGLYIASAYTETPDVETVEEYLECLQRGDHEACGSHGSSLMMGRNFYSIAYRYYREKLLGDDHSGDLFSIMVGRLLRGEEIANISTADKVREAAKRFIKPRKKTMGQIDRVLATELIEWVSAAEADADSSIEERSFRTASELGQQLSYASFRKSFKHLKKGKLTESLQTMASLGPVAMCVAPYLAAFQTQHKDERLHQSVADHFVAARLLRRRSEKRAWFTDTFQQMNGVSLTVETCARIARQHHREIEVLTSEAATDESRDFVRNFAPIGDFSMPELKGQSLSFPPFMEMIRYCEAEQFSEAIISTPGPVGLCGLAAGKLLGLKLTGIYHTDYPLYVRYLTASQSLEEMSRRYLRWFYSQMDSVFVPSTFYKNELEERGLDPEKIRLLPRGLDRKLFNPERRDPRFWDRYGIRPGFKFVYVGRIAEEKNLDELLRAFIGVREDHEEAQLVMVGDGPYLEELQSRYRRPEILFTGYLEEEDLAAAYASSDVLVSPSTTDTFGNAVLEAQACGLPVIIDHSGGVAEVVEGSESGSVIDMSGAGELQATMTRLLVDSPQRHRMARAARETAKADSWEALLTRLWHDEGGEDDSQVPLQSVQSDSSTTPAEAHA